MALPPAVAASVPPDTVAPSSSTCAPLPDARIRALAVLLMTPSIVTAAPAPRASMTLEFLTLSSMTRSPPEVASSVPELVTVFPVEMVSGEAALALMVPLLISVRPPPPITPPPAMTSLMLVSDTVPP
jgi:hypothetical protein